MKCILLALLKPRYNIQPQACREYLTHNHWLICTQQSCGRASWGAS